MSPVLDITTAIPRMTVNGASSHYTFAMVIDHVNRTVSGSIIEMPENEPLNQVLRSLRKGDVVDLNFKSIATPSGPEEVIEYSGKAEPIFVRVRPNRREVYAVKFRFRLLE